jgi:hypothetical protein
MSRNVKVCGGLLHAFNPSRRKNFFILRNAAGVASKDEEIFAPQDEGWF